MVSIRAGVTSIQNKYKEAQLSWKSCRISTPWGRAGGSYELTYRKYNLRVTWNSESVLAGKNTGSARHLVAKTTILQAPCDQSNHFKSLLTSKKEQVRLHVHYVACHVKFRLVQLVEICDEMCALTVLGSYKASHCACTTAVLYTYIVIIIIR